MASLRRIRPTRRGIGVAAIVVIGGALAVLTGRGALGAVVVPGAVALLVGAVQVLRADDPAVERATPKPGFPGERRDVSVAVDSRVPCTVVESVGSGCAVVSAGETGTATAGEATVAVGHGGTFEYTVELGRRGEHRLGPARCRLVGSLGLFGYTVGTDGTGTVLVYPELHDVDPGSFAGLERGLRGNDRSTFDRLREYTPADTVRDIHWRASAKRADGEFVVAEYGGRTTHSGVTIVGESTEDGADAMASAVASVAVHLDAGGVPVTVVVPDGESPAGAGASAAALRLLARTDGGECGTAERDRADLHVRGDGDGATVTAAGRGFAFDAIVEGKQTGERSGTGVVAG